MVVVDYCSKQAHFMATNTTLTAEGAARLYVENVFKHHGLSESITSDRGPQFASSFADGFRKLLGMEGRLSTAYHPETDGQTERVNREVEQYLRRYTNYEQDDWVTWLPLAEFTYNDQVHSATGHSPFYLNYGQHPWKGLTHIPPHPNESATEFVTRMQTIREEALAALRYTREDMTRFYARKQNQSLKYKIGDKVWLEGTNLTTQRPSKKLEHKRFGPFTVKATYGTAYKLDIPRSWKNIHPVFHETLLSPYHIPAFSSQEVTPPPVEIVNNHPEYEVEQILKARRWGRGIRFLVHWKGYPHEEDTWEPRSNLTHAQELLDDFYRKNPEAPGNTERTRSVKVDLETDAILPIRQEFLDQIMEGTKVAEYRSYEMPTVQRLWFMPVGQPHITHMAEVLPGKQHMDIRPDGTKKRPWKYEYTTVYQLPRPFIYRDPRLLCDKPSGPVYFQPTAISLGGQDRQPQMRRIGVMK
jgi:hypothetical protein